MRGRSRTTRTERWCGTRRGRITCTGLDGKELGTYTVSWDSNGTPTVAMVRKWGYFNGKIIGGAQDRLGSMRAAGWMLPASYRSYGAASTGSDFNMFATYPEINGGMYYADQRMYNPQMGKFFSPDPGGMKTAKPKYPGSWNRYSYANNDPVNFYDPSGLIAKLPTDSIENNPCDDAPDQPGCAVYACSITGKSLLQAEMPFCPVQEEATGEGGDYDPEPRPTGFYLVDVAAKDCVDQEGLTGMFALDITYQLMLDGKPFDRLCRI